jgi:hypothetical protein
MFLALTLGSLVLALFVWLMLRGSTVSRIPSKAGQEAILSQEAGTRTNAGPRPGTCVLCGSTLTSGQRIKSDLAPGPGDRIMRIFGCPHCLGSSETRLPRVCPVCGSELGPLEFAVARYFERPGRKHVHVLGCQHCRKTL